MNIISNVKKRLKFCAQKLVRTSVKIVAPCFKTQNNKIMIVAIKRKGYSDNLKYVCEDLLSAYGDRLTLVWATEFPETCDEIVKRGIKVVRLASKQYIIEQLTSKVVVYNDAIPPYMPKTKGQIYLNTWHGGINFKHIGYDYLFDQSSLSLKKFALGNPPPDYFISGSRFFTENTAESFRFSRDVFLPWGLPRNDILFETEKHAEIIKKVREYYNVPDGKKIVLYAPTFRVRFESDLHELDVKSLRAALSDRFGGDWIVFYRGHYFVKNDDRSGKNVIDATQYPDSQEILIASDALVSDYSSMMWDMSFLSRPIFSYAPDAENYEKNERAFAYPMEKWPYDIAFDNESLAKKIKEFDQKTFDEKLNAFFIEAGSFERPDTCRKVTELIGSICLKEEKK